MIDRLFLTARLQALPVGITSILSIAVFLGIKAFKKWRDVPFVYPQEIAEGVYPATHFSYNWVDGERSLEVVFVQKGIDRLTRIVKNFDVVCVKDQDEPTLQVSRRGLATRLVIRWPAK